MGAQTKRHTRCRVVRAWWMGGATSSDADASPGKENQSCFQCTSALKSPQLCPATSSSQMPGIDLNSRGCSAAKGRKRPTTDQPQPRAKGVRWGTCNFVWLDSYIDQAIVTNDGGPAFVLGYSEVDTLELSIDLVDRVKQKQEDKPKFQKHAPSLRRRMLNHLEKAPASTEKSNFTAPLDSISMQRRRRSKPPSPCISPCASPILSPCLQPMASPCSMLPLPEPQLSSESDSLKSERMIDLESYATDGSTCGVAHSSCLSHPQFLKAPIVVSPVVSPMKSSLLESTVPMRSPESTAIVPVVSHVGSPQTA